MKKLNLVFLGVLVFIMLSFAVIAVTGNGYVVECVVDDFSEESALSGYVKFEGVDGEAQDSAHKGWSEIVSFNQEIRKPTTGTGATRRRGDVILEDILNAIVKQDPRYTWTSKGTRINLEMDGLRERDGYILNEVLNEFDASQKTRREIVAAVIEQLEIQSPGKYRLKTEEGSVDRLQLVEIPFDMLYINPPELPRYDMHVKNVSVRDILNLISEKENIAWKSYTTSRDGADVTDLSFEWEWDRTAE